MAILKQPTVPRYLTRLQLYEYTTLRRPTAEQLAKEAGARIVLPNTRRVLYDREKLDQYLQSIADQGKEGH